MYTVTLSLLFIIENKIKNRKRNCKNMMYAECGHVHTNERQNDGAITNYVMSSIVTSTPRELSLSLVIITVIECLMYMLLAYVMFMDDGG